MADEEIFAQYPVASWQVGRLPTVRFPIVGPLREQIGARLVEHKRPYREGAKLDDTGGDPRVWSFTALFNNSIVEQGSAFQDNGQLLYPFMLRAMVDSFAIKETGNLILPTVGLVRARMQSCERVEDIAARNEGSLALVFKHDNEESLEAASFRLPSVRASVVKLTDQTVFSADREGALDSDTITLQELASEIEGLMLAPGRSVADLQTRVTAARRALGRVLRAQEQLAEDVDGPAADPRGSEFWRNLARLSDNQAKAVDEKFSSLPRVTTFVVDVERTSLFAIAARLGQSADDLLDLNGERVADPFFLERGDVIRVFAGA